MVSATANRNRGDSASSAGRDEVFLHGTDGGTTVRGRARWVGVGALRVTVPYGTAKVCGERWDITVPADERAASPDLGSHLRVRLLAADAECGGEGAGEILLLQLLSESD